MTGIYSRRRLEVQGVSMSSLKNHPPAEDEFENPHSVYSTTGSRRVSIASETLSCSTNCSSLSSVDDDDFEKESAQTIQHLFDDIDSVLYDDTLIASNNNLMSEECKDWIDQYPHFRIIGKQIIPEEDIGFEIVNVKSESSTPASSLNEEVAEENVKLSVQGKQMDIYIPPLTNVNKDQSEEFGLKSQEEIILQDGEYEELIGRESFEEVCRLREQIIETKCGASTAASGGGRPSKKPPRIPMVIVGNKCDKDADRTVTPEEVANYVANLPCCAFVETSAKRNVRVEDVFCELFVLGQLPLEMSPSLHKRVQPGFLGFCQSPTRRGLSLRRRLSDAYGTVAPNARRPSIRTDLLILQTKTAAYTGPPTGRRREISCVLQ